jgi:hypothetical protein
MTEFDFQLYLDMITGAAPSSPVAASWVELMLLPEVH